MLCFDAVNCVLKPALFLLDNTGVCMQVATEMSEDKARQGGDLGWKRRTDLVGPFADVAFQLEVFGAVQHRCALLCLNLQNDP